MALIITEHSGKEFSLSVNRPTGLLEAEETGQITERETVPWDMTRSCYIPQDEDDPECL